MAAKTKKLTTAVEAFFADLRRIRQSGAATDERSTYAPLANLLNAIGATLKPKVYCLVEPADQGAGHPDLYLYTEKQIQKGQPRKGQTPERGVVEVKAPDEDTKAQPVRDQVSRYWQRYRLVLVTNLLEFELVGQGPAGEEVTLETFRLADSEAELDHALEKPRAFANRVGAGLSEYLCRGLSHKAALTEPKDLAWLLASYARDGLARVEQAGDAPALKDVRSALEEALGVSFEGERGDHFFHSTLVQTLFYGVFSAWVLWTRSKPPGNERFRWRDAVWHLRAPVLQALFHQLSNPARLQPLGLVEVLDWTADALNRVDRLAFFERFNEGEAVPYFYEPFLEAFDPELRKQLGVWYTPREVVQYMVARVDRALKDDLGIADGLAAENVYILDPCCGTGAYLAEVLRRIAANLQGRGLGALAGSMVKKAAVERVFGFEIMPAPFVVAHLQVGLTMQDLDAALAGDGSDRVGVYLTNALTGWEPTDKEKQVVAFPELKEERDKANKVKRERPILVILGNPPYNGFAGVAMEEERELSTAYRTTKKVRRPQGHGLNDLYVRFFRMAERRIAEKTGQGVVCFISNYSWLDGLSFTGMRERYLEAFDAVRIDCLNGDKYKTGKVAPDGSPDPSIFSTENDPVGIQVGTAIATLVRKASHGAASSVEFRHLWGQSKREELAATAETAPESLYENNNPVLPLGLPFLPTAVSEKWFDWPTLPELFPASFPGVKTSRDSFLVDIDQHRLEARIADYFNEQLSHEEIGRRYPSAMKTTARFDTAKVREGLLARSRMDTKAPDMSEVGAAKRPADSEGPEAAGAARPADADESDGGGEPGAEAAGPTGIPGIESGIVRFAYRPFDNRWLYWERDTQLLDRNRSDYKPHVFKGNLWLVAQQKPRRGWSRPQVISAIGCLDLMDRGATCFPCWLNDDGMRAVDGVPNRRANLSAAAENYIEATGVTVEDLFHHVLAVLHDPAYREANAGALCMEWPRIPLPGWPAPDRADIASASSAAEALAQSAARGRKVARLLDPEKPVPGVTQGTLRPELAAVAVPATTDGSNMKADDYKVSAGWGRFGSNNTVMPGPGKVIKRDYTPAERTALADALDALGDSTYDIHLNGRAFWRNVTTAVWNYKLGGYQVLKKWLSYREQSILNRPLTPDEARYFTNTARRIAALLLAVRRRGE
ncbi:MAG: N-6 DNA methylase [Gammaproteobacteria bacterium]|nr:N-6 DNA methylase [Gammaproteobacteria bacterium]MYD01512.1 N-6 DNA methylase [Gammaproteobacteria bacterium]MYI26120.1 N-6 DNA methylase [Gammaproteobacteria bacterium]